MATNGFQGFGVSDADIQAILGSGEIAGKQGLLNQQMAQAQSLRNTPLPGGRSAGGMYVAQNPLETIGAVAKQIYGQRQQGDLSQQAQDLLKLQTQNRAKFLNLLGGGQPAGPMQGPPAPGQMEST